MKKRGQIGIAQSTAQELVLAAAFIFFLLMMAFQIINPIAVNKQFISRDIGVLTGLVQSSPFLISVNYSNKYLNLSEYNLNWTKSRFVVTYGKNEARPTTHNFLRNMNIFSKNTGVVNTEFLHFFNDRDQLYINSEFKDYKSKMNCKNFEINSVFIDPGHGDGNGFVYDNKGEIFDEEVKVCRIAAKITPLSIDVDSSRPMDEGLIRCFGTERRTESEVLSALRKNDLILSLHVGDYETEENIIKIFVEDNEGFEIANAVACEILNKLDKGGLIIPVKQAYNDLNHFEVFEITEKPVVVIELGSLRSERTREMLKFELEQIAEVLKEVLNE